MDYYKQYIEWSSKMFVCIKYYFKIGDFLIYSLVYNILYYMVGLRFEYEHENIFWSSVLNFKNLVTIIRVQWTSNVYVSAHFSS